MAIISLDKRVQRGDCEHGKPMMQIFDKGRDCDDCWACAICGANNRLNQHKTTLDSDVLCPSHMNEWLGIE